MQHGSHACRAASISIQVLVLNIWYSKCHFCGVHCVASNILNFIHFSKPFMYVYVYHHVPMYSAPSKESTFWFS